MGPASSLHRGGGATTGQRRPRQTGIVALEDRFLPLERLRSRIFPKPIGRPDKGVMGGKMRRTKLINGFLGSAEYHNRLFVFHVSWF